VGPITARPEFATLQRLPTGYDAAFVFDPDGNNIEAVFRGG